MHLNKNLQLYILHTMRFKSSLSRSSDLRASYTCFVVSGHSGNLGKIHPSAVISLDSQMFTLILLGGFELAHDNRVNEIFWSCNSKDMKK